jgi:hypothetical protein
MVRLSVNFLFSALVNNRTHGVQANSTLSPIMPMASVKNAKNDGQNPSWRTRPFRSPEIGFQAS